MHCHSRVYPELVEGQAEIQRFNALKKILAFTGMKIRMNNIKLLFFGSTSDSVLVLEKLFTFHFSLFTLHISAVVTQPPKAAGRNLLLTPTPVEIWAKAHNIPLLSFPTNPEKSWLFENEQTVIDTLAPFRADLLISTSYGQKIPTETITAAKYGGLNVHPSILPRWRGGDPVPWAILSGDSQIGVSVVTLAEKFDEGKIIAQKKIPIPKDAVPGPLRTKLFTIGAELLIKAFPKYLNSPVIPPASPVIPPASPVIPPASPVIPAKAGIQTDGSPTKSGMTTKQTQPYARRLTRDDGFVPWELVQQASEGKDLLGKTRPGILAYGIGHVSFAIERLVRALSPWPGVWTKVQMTNDKLPMTNEKRLKILNAHTENEHLVIDEVQLEGKKPVSFAQFQKAYLQDHSN